MPESTAVLAMKPLEMVRRKGGELGATTVAVVGSARNPQEGEDGLLGA